MAKSTSKKPAFIPVSEIDPDGGDGWGPELTPEQAQERINAAAARARADTAPVPHATPKERPAGVLSGLEKTQAGLAAALAHIGIECRYDLRAARAEVRGTEDADAAWTRTNDRSISALQEEIAAYCTGKANDPLKFGDTTWRRCFNAILFNSEVDPFHEWLLALPAWDGTPRLHHWLRDVFATDPDCELIRWASEFVFLGAVQRTFLPGCKLDEIPVLIGPQGIGKSTALRWAFPEDQADAWFADGLHLAAEPQKRVEALLGRVIVEVAEMAGSTRADLDSLKSFLTAQNDGAYRLAYRRDPEDLPRRCVMVGTADKDDCLPNDPAGNRRFVAIHLAAGDRGQPGVRAYMDAHRQDLWAEALYGYEAGHRAHLPEDLKPAQAAVNEQHRRRDDLMEDAVAAWVKQAPAAFTLAQAARGCGLTNVESEAARLDMRTSRRLGNALRGLGCTNSRVRNDHGGRERRWFAPA